MGFAPLDPPARVSPSAHRSRLPDKNNQNHPLDNFDYSCYAARLLTYFEINNACTTQPWNSHYALDNCQYFLTNGNYAAGGNCYSYENTVGHYYVGVVLPNSAYGCTRCITDSNCPIRPAIDVPIEKIDY